MAGIKTRTSESHPLEIAELKVGGGVVGVTLCPGKRGPALGGYRWERDLASDVEVIRRWGASAVVTLIEEHEFETLEVVGLGGAIAAAGIEWHHLPVTDVLPPDARFELRWQYAGVRLRERLRAGQRVLVHCRGGLGRAGSVAARLLVEFGERPAVAVHRVRAVRPGAIETEAQERWVHAQRAVDASAERRRSRELACLLGGAIGDAFGYRVEFDSLATIRGRYGPQGLRLAEANGELVVSDDTQMTLFTLEGMLRARREGGLVIDALRRAYLDWYRTQRGRWHAAEEHTGLLAHRELWHGRAPGNTCMAALAAGGQGTPAAPINDSKGCGGVMRTAPLGFLAREVEDHEVYVAGAAAGALTHGHPDGYAPAGVMALAVGALLQAADWGEAIAAGQRALGRHPAATGTTARLVEVHRALEAGVAAAEAPRFGQGWVGDEALAVGLHAAAAASSFSEAVEAATNHDGDSDSTASIAGQLYGARHGLACLPAAKVYRLDVLEAVLGVFADWERVRGDASR
jgi:ADP-ribosylglycohydrolase